MLKAKISRLNLFWSRALRALQHAEGWRSGDRGGTWIYFPGRIAVVGRVYGDVGVDGLAGRRRTARESRSEGLAKDQEADVELAGTECMHATGLPQPPSGGVMSLLTV